MTRTSPTTPCMRSDPSKSRVRPLSLTFTYTHSSNDQNITENMIYVSIVSYIYLHNIYINIMEMALRSDLVEVITFGLEEGSKGVPERDVGVVSDTLRLSRRQNHHHQWRSRYDNHNNHDN